MTHRFHKLALFLSLLLTFSAPMAQDFNWAYRFDGSDKQGLNEHDIAEGVYVDSQGDILIYGSFDETIDCDLGPGQTLLQTSSTSWKSNFIAKYDPSMSLLWAFTFSNPDGITPFDVALDAQDNIYQVTHINTYYTTDVDPGPGSHLLTGNGYQEYLLKFGPGSNFLNAWPDSTFNANYLDMEISGNRIYIAFRHGNVLDLDWGPGVVNSGANLPSTYFHVIACYDLNGNYINSIPFGPKGFRGNMDIVLDGSGNLFVSGGAMDFDSIYQWQIDPNGPGQTIALESGVYRTPFLKYDSNLVLQNHWMIEGRLNYRKLSEVYGSNNSEGMCIMPDGGLAFAANFGSDTLFPVPGQPGYGLPDTTPSTGEIFMGRFSDTLGPMWFQQIGGIAREWVNDCKVNENGDIFLTGYMQNRNYPVTYPVDMDPGPDSMFLYIEEQTTFLAQYAPNGDFLWAHGWSTPNVRSVGTAVAPTPNGQVLMAGTFFGTLDFDPGPGTNLINSTSSESNIFIASFQQDTCPDIQTTVTTLSAISCAGASDGMASIQASNGYPPYSYHWSNGQTTNSASGLAEGTYSVTVTDGRSRCTAIDSITLTAPPALTGQVLTINEDDGTCNGSIQVQATGGSGSLSYQWDAGASNQTTALASGLCAGNYCLTVTDTAGCSWDTCGLALPLGLEHPAPAFQSTITPNPTTSMTLIKAEAVPALQVHLQLRDAFGRKLREWEAETQNGILSLSMDLGTLSDGIYLLSVVAGGSSVHHKVLLLR